MKKPLDDFNGDPFHKQRNSPRDPSLRSQPGAVDKGRQNRNLLLAIGAVVFAGILWTQQTAEHNPSATAPVQITGATTGNAVTPPAASPAAPAPSSASDFVHTLKDNSMGCRDRARLDTLIGYLAVGDKATYMSDGQAAMDAGECAELFKGTAVFLEEVPFMQGLMQIREKGKTAKWWVTVESVN